MVKDMKSIRPEDTESTIAPLYSFYDKVCDLCQEEVL